MQALNEIKTWLGQTGTTAAVRSPASQSNGKQVLFKGNNPQVKFAAAQKLAQEAGRELQRIDLSKVVGKYMGETEKNLAAIFEKAASKNVVLYFDEADALLGKRTNVKEAHDKYANQEVNYLLQKIEAYPGLAILSLNAKSNIDKAFIRRIGSVVAFDGGSH